jgi:hypothetical protein
MIDKTPIASTTSRRSLTETFMPPLKTGINITVACERKGLSLRFIDHFINGGSANSDNKYGDGNTNRIDIDYTSNAIRKSFKGGLVCQIQGIQELSCDTLIIIGWKIPIFSSIQAYAVLVEVERNVPKWDPKTVIDQYKYFCNRLRTLTGPIEEAWYLGDNIKIKLITKPYDKNVGFKITICGDKEGDENRSHPLQITPRR